MANSRKVVQDHVSSRHLSAKTCTRRFFNHMRLINQNNFFNYLRMTSTEFDVLLHKVSLQIQKTICIREPIPAAEWLTVPSR